VTLQGNIEIGVIIKECPAEILIKLAIVLKISKV
jgi:hypothetical protein